MRCLGRIQKRKEYDVFGDTVYRFHFEYRCEREITAEAAKKDPYRCDICQKRLKSPAAHQFIQGFDHGLVTEPIPPLSRFYCGQWYEANVVRYGMPSMEAIKKALHCQTMARDVSDWPSLTAAAAPPKVAPPLEQQQEQNMPRKASAATATTIVENAEEPKKRRVPVKKQPVLPVPVPVPVPVPDAQQEEPQPSAKKKRAPPKPKPKAKPVVESAMKDLAVVPPAMEQTLLPTHLEHTAEEIDTDSYEVVQVVLVPREIGGVMYYYNEAKQKVYARPKKGQVGPYVGRLDRWRDCVVEDVADSDDECNEEDM